MNNIQKLTKKIYVMEEKFGVDARDLDLLGFICNQWDSHDSVRMMDIVKASNIASATTTLNIIKDLEFVSIIKINGNPDDAREKIIVQGKKFASLDKFLGGL